MAQTTQATELNQEQLKLLNYINYSPTSMDTLCNETGESIENIAAHLLILELQGYISDTNGGCYTRIK